MALFRRYPILMNMFVAHFACLSLIFLVSWSHAAIPDYYVKFEGSQQDILVQRAAFGSSAKVVSGVLRAAPFDDLYLCAMFDPASAPTIPPVQLPGPVILLVKRGLCSFEEKALAAKKLYGAVGILIFDNLESRYRWNATTQRVGWPVNTLDYECGNGYGTMSKLYLDPPQYDGRLLDPLMDMTLPTSQCNLISPSPCNSQLCLVVGPRKDNTTEFPVCCAWDTPLTMQPDNTLKESPNDVLAAFVTIRQAPQFLDKVGVTVTIDARPTKAWNTSFIFLWLLGVSVEVFATWYSARDYRYFRAKLARMKAKRRKKEDSNEHAGEDSPEDKDADENNTNDRIEEGLGNDPDTFEEEEAAGKEEQHQKGTIDLLRRRLNAFFGGGDKRRREIGQESEAKSENDAEYEDVKMVEQDASLGKEKAETSEAEALHSIPPLRTKDDHDPVFSYERRKKSKSALLQEPMVLYSVPPPSRNKRREAAADEADEQVEGVTDVEDNDELPEASRSSGGAMELKAYHVAIFLVCSSILLLLLFYFHFYYFVIVLYALACAGGVSYLIFSPLLSKIIPRLGEEVVEELNKKVLCCLNGFDVISQGAAYIWAAVWCWYGLSHYRPSENWFFWITMDIFGSCFCIVMLSMLKLNSIKIATVFMVAIFFYGKSFALTSMTTFFC